MSPLINMVIALAKPQRFARIRQLHSIISQETIKPFSQTPAHLKTYNLSLLDRYAPNIHMPWVFFYPNCKSDCDIKILKKSLSQSLTQYYPFAGRFLAPDHIDCNDAGVEFLEACIDCRLEDETLNQLIPNALGCPVNKTSPNIVEVQLNHFTCGGATVAVSISHKVADVFTMVNFLNHWATVTRGGSPIINPSFFSSSIESDIIVPEFPIPHTGKIKNSIWRFVFPNSKLNELKNKINEMGTTPMNPTRVESLTSLLFKCAVGASTTITGNLCQTVNLRNKKNAFFPKIVDGNVYINVTANMMVDSVSGEFELNKTIASMRKKLMEFQGIRDMKEIGEKLANKLGDNKSRCYNFSSLCRFPFYEVDFGWGKPEQVILETGTGDGCFVMLMDTPSGDGIEATVNLRKQEMAIFQTNKELLAYVEDI